MSNPVLFRSDEGIKISDRKNSLTFGVSIHANYYFKIIVKYFLSRKICSRKAEILFKKEFRSGCHVVSPHVCIHSSWSRGGPMSTKPNPPGKPHFCSSSMKEMIRTRINSPNGKHKCTLVEKTVSRKKKVVLRTVTTDNKEISVLLKEVRGKQYLWYWRGEDVHKPRVSDSPE